MREAEEIVAQEAARFAEWRRSRGAAGAIRALRDRAEAIRSEELARVLEAPGVVHLRYSVVR